ncbi:MAG: OmpH family outer membrane protein [Desulfovibrio sp.]|jgi:outer membrane protein|nr:OmpH family outer membrane protein [Desulfovibrio sp.]MBQ1845796.1 OmpH family outer membrane protein [Desulfovibrio sp.]MBQ2517108.1 OmpH family outer membrane protein [Desulfovibrio sp.]MBQ4124534.1 OmpH family outer membrane protein [Desulfovibrio sp.]MCR5169021.1 OmpH family outer membrane protein [Desulfovibrio sp.]
MHKRFILSLLLALSLCLGACEEGSSKGGPTVGIVDLSRLVRDSEPGKAANAFLEKTQKSFNDRILALQNKLQANADDEKVRAEFQSLYLGLQQRMQAEEQNVNNVLLDHILRTVKEYRAKQGLGAIVRSEAVLDYDKALDITDMILDELNKKNIEFKAVTSDQPKAEDAKAADAGKEGAGKDEAKAPEAAKPAEAKKDEAKKDAPKAKDEKKK